MSDVLVLAYHAVSSEWRSPLSVSPDLLEAQVRRKLEGGYEPVTFTDAVRAHRAARSGTHRRCGRLLAVTFDDAYASVLTHAQPALERLGAPATVFVPTDHPARGAPMSWPGIDHWVGTPDEQELMPMSWGQLGGLAARGWEIGSHTCSHPHLTTLDDADLARELTVSRAVCERELGRPCTSLAYPYGDFDERVARAASEAGYETCATLNAQTQPWDPMQWPRVSVYDVDQRWRFALKASPAVRRLLASPRLARARARRSTS